jgi:hypothetical protein
VETLQSDLVIDAAGNGSLKLEFLKASGRRVPEETRIGVNMRYASALFDHAEIRDNYKFAYTFPNAPEKSRGGLIVPAENGSYQVLLIGRGEDVPPINESEFRISLLDDPSIVSKIEEETPTLQSCLFQVSAPLVFKEKASGGLWRPWPQINSLHSTAVE